MKTKKKNIYITTVIQVMASAFALAVIYSMNILPSNMTLIALGSLLFLLIIKIVFDVHGKKRKRAHKFINVLSALISLTIFAVAFYGMYTFNTLMQSTGKDVKTENISVIVLADSDYSRLKDLKGAVFSIRDIINLDSTNYAIDEINDKLEEEIATTAYIDFQSQVEALYEEDAQALILNEAYRSLIEEYYTDFSEKTKVIYTVRREVPLDESVTASASVEEPFIVYISGIDTYGEISTSSRSDVNILAVVNPTTKEILLVNIPRDYYVEIDGGKGAKDKLTHAGLYGVDCSIKTIENLLDVDISYYAKVNFTSMVDIIDILDGIDVYSQYAFTDIEGHYVEKGIQHMSGEEALAFARERHHLPGGDRDRGKNQQEVIKAMIKKIVSPSIITNMTSLVKTASSGVETNLTSDEISSLVQMQLTDMASWDITTTSVDGAGANMPTYSFGSQRLYVMIPDEDTVSAAKEEINNILSSGQEQTDGESEEGEN
jgi:LCP family protein required for cell wall assembly